MKVHETDLQRAAWDVPHRGELARHLADALLARGSLGYVLLGMQPLGPFYVGPQGLCYLGDLPEALVARVLGLWLRAWGSLMREHGVPHPSPLAEAVREELRRRAELGYMPAAPREHIP